MLCSYSVIEELIAYETWHGVMWPKWRRSRQGLAWWTGCNGEGQVKALKRGTARRWSLGKIWRRWTEATVKSEQGQDRWTKEVMWWYGVDHIIQERSSQVLTHDDDQKAWWSLVLVWHQHLGRWNGMRKAKVWLVGHFISPVKGCVEKCMTGFRIDGRTIKRGKLVCISVI